MQPMFSFDVKHRSERFPCEERERGRIPTGQRCQMMDDICELGPSEGYLLSIELHGSK